jgi:hypothetical protein
MVIENKDSLASNDNLGTATAAVTIAPPILEMLLHCGRKDEFFVRGYSMGRSVPHNAKVRLVKLLPSQLRVGQVIAFETSNRRIVHRIVRIGKRGNGCGFVLTRGDNRFFPDAPVPVTAILGVVKEISLDSRWQPFSSTKVPRLMPRVWGVIVDYISSLLFEIDIHFLLSGVKWCTRIEQGWQDQKRFRARERWNIRHSGAKVLR